MNPVNNERKVYIFPDVPHCLKNLRNHCLDSTMVIDKGGGLRITLGKDNFEHLIRLDNSDFKLCPKLTPTHIYVKGSDRQRVRTAAQLFSDTVSKAFIHKFGDDYREQADVIRVIDGWFDTMNSRQRIDKKNNKCGLGKSNHFILQNFAF